MTMNPNHFNSPLQNGAEPKSDQNQKQQDSAKPTQPGIATTKTAPTTSTK